jgi:hypothetical protein
MPAVYPTRAEILEPRMKLKREALADLKLWKTLFYDQFTAAAPFARQLSTVAWKHKTSESKHTDLQILMTTMSHRYEKPLLISASDHYAYSPMTRTLYFDGSNPSIISFLHEFGHHILGDSETKACRWSVHMFKKAFPRAYSRLTWNGHMLKKAQS